MMTFYSVSYLTAHQQMNQLFNYLAMAIFVLLVIITSVLYYRHRLITRYRDLGVIFFLLLLLTIGMQVTKIERNNTQQAQTAEMIPFMKSVARDHGVATEDVSVNSTTLDDGIIVRIKRADYRVNLSPNHDNYTLTRAHVVNHQVNLLK